VKLPHLEEAPLAVGYRCLGLALKGMVPATFSVAASTTVRFIPSPLFTKTRLAPAS
jgi:hypothetical protein